MFLKKFEQIGFVVRAFAYALVRGNAKRAGERKRFVVINQTKNIGDMIFVTPVFHAIKTAVPDAYLTVIGQPKNKITLAHNPDIDEYIECTLPEKDIISTLKKGNYDIGLVMMPDTQSLATLFLGNVREISAFVFPGREDEAHTRSYRALLSLCNAVSYTFHAYVGLENLKLLKPFGIESTEIQKHLGFSKEAEATINDAMKKAGVGADEPVVAIAPGASTPIKQWPSTKFAEVGNYLSQTYGAPLFLVGGGPNDVRAGEEMISKLDAGVRYVNFINQSLDELKATLSKVRLIIGNDSGSIYVTEAFGGSTLVLVGPTDEAEHPLRDRTHSIVVAKDREEALLQSFIKNEEDINRDEAVSLMESISVGEVLKEVDSLFTELKIERR